MERYETVVKNAKFSYKQVETLVLYFEAEALRIPADLLANNGNAGRRITPDYQKLIASFKELTRHVENLEEIKEQGLIDELSAANNQYDRFE